MFKTSYHEKSSLRLFPASRGFVASCCTKDDDIVQPPTNCKISKIFYDDSARVYNLSYDNQGRLLSFVGDGVDGYYAYFGDTVIVTISTGSAYTDSILIVLNPAGFLIVRDHVRGWNPVPDTYEYNAQNQLQKSTSYSDLGPSYDTVMYHWQNGNLMSQTRGATVLVTYEYDMSKPATDGDFFYAQDLVRNFVKTIHTTNLLKKVVYSTGFSTMHYEYDSWDRIKTLRVSNSQNTDTSKSEYGYICNQ